MKTKVKGIITLAMAVFMLLSVVACTEAPAATAPTESAAASAEPAAASTETTETADGAAEEVAKESFDFKVGIMTTNVAGSSEEPYRTAMKLQEKYGKDHIIVDSFPVNFSSEVEVSVSKVMAMAADPDVKAIVFCHAVNGTMACIQALKEKRPDIYTVCCSPSEDVKQLSEIADLCLNKDQYMLGEQIAAQAIAAGAKAFVHYSIPNHMSNVLTAARGEIIRERCEAAGIQFVYVTTPDPQGDAGYAGSQQFVIEDIPLEIAKYGEDTAFFTTVNQQNEVVIKTVIKCHGIYITQSDPTPFNHFPGAMEIEVPEERRGDTPWMLEQLSAKAAEVNMTGRLSAWKCSILDLFEQTGVEYAIAHVQGKTSETDGKINLDDISTIAKGVAGTDVQSCYIANAEGIEYDNYIGLLCGLYVF